ncbi:hypothetical protein ACFL0D_02375 [Thermoproteota archaeon]
MVLETLRTNDIKYLVVAIIIHVAIDYLKVSMMGYSILYAELVVTGFAIGLAYWACYKVKDNIIA